MTNPMIDDPKGLVAVEQVDRDRAAPHVIAPENEKKIRRGEMDWQPIETAPKDGSWIWVYGERFMDEPMPPYGLTFWEPKVEEWWEQVSEKRKELVTKDVSGWNIDCGIWPSHWRSLVPPQARPDHEADGGYPRLAPS